MSEKLIAKSYVEKIDDTGILEVAVASDGVVDRDGDTISPDGWELDSFLKNPQFLWGHNVREYRLPIGKVEKIWVEGEGDNKRLMFTPKFDLKDDFAREVFRKYQEGYLNAFSVGLLPIDVDGNNIAKAELLEISAVAVPANPNALVVLRGAGMKSMDWKELAKFEDKASVPFKSYEALPDSASWNQPEAIKRVKEWATEDGVLDINKYKSAFTWYDKENEDKPTAYKLPHHDVRGIDLVTNWRGVASAMALLLGANGGIDLSDEDRKEVYDHLAKHYKQFDKEVPEYRHVEEQTLKVLGEEIQVSAEQEFEGYVKYTLRSITKELKRNRKLKLKGGEKK